MSSMEASSIPSQFSVRRPITSESIRNPRRALLGFANLHKYPTKSRYLQTSLCLATGNDGFRKEQHRVGDRDGVIIVDHGSRRKESNLMLNEFVAMFRDKTGYPIVEPAHMELAEPSIRDAFSSCVQQGENCVIVSPFFLFPGRHWHKDIPFLTAEAAKEHLGMSYIITAPLGLHELIVNPTPLEPGECSLCAGTGKCQVY